MAEQNNPANKMTFMLAQRNGDSPLDWTHHTIKAGERFVIGRNAQCDLQLISKGIANQHCAIELREGSLWLVDLGSFFGTQQNNVRIERVQLSSGDTITVGSVVFFLSLGDVANKP